MQLKFSNFSYHIPKWYVLDATNQKLGNLVALIIKLICGKKLLLYTKEKFQPNYVIIINSNKIKLSGQKLSQKKYYTNSQRPGSLKIKTAKMLLNTIPNRLIEEAVWGMLAKNKISHQFYKYLYVYENNKILLSKNNINFNIIKLNKNNFLHD
jgi:large subunit ribosomal protein L13